MEEIDIIDLSEKELLSKMGVGADISKEFIKFLERKNLKIYNKLK